MSHDRFSNDHTIEVYGEEEILKLHTSGSGAGFSGILIQGGTATHNLVSPTFNDVCIISSDDIKIHSDDDIELITNTLILKTQAAGTDGSEYNNAAPGDPEGGILISATDSIQMFSDTRLHLYTGQGMRIHNSNTQTWSGLVVDNLSGNTGALAKFRIDENSVVTIQNDGSIDADGTIATTSGLVDCNNFRMRAGTAGGASDDNVIVSDASGYATWGSATGAIDWTNINPDTDINFLPESGFDLSVDAEDIDIKSDGADGLALQATWGATSIYSSANTNIDALLYVNIGTGDSSTNAHIDHAITQSQAINMHANVINLESNGVSMNLLSSSSDGLDIDTNKVSIVGSNSNNLLYVQNNNNSGTAIRTYLNFTPGGGNFWLDCYSSGGTLRGGLRGAGVVDASGSPGSILFGWSIVAGIIPGYVGTLFSAPLLTDAGNVQYTSGAADFGEWLEAGDRDEWSDIISNFYSKSKSNKYEKGILPIAEGSLVWVHDNKFWRYKRHSKTRPMIVTNSAFLLGNAGEIFKEGEEIKDGAVLSFSGQTHVLIKGKVDCGDLLVPNPEYNCCVGMKIDDMSLKDYNMAIGTASTSCEAIQKYLDENSDEQETEYNLVRCLIMVK